MADDQTFDEKMEKHIIGYWKDLVERSRDGYRSIDADIKKSFVSSFFLISFLCNQLFVLFWLFDGHFSRNWLRVFSLVCIPLIPYIANTVYYRLRETRLAESFGDGTFRDIPEDIMSNELKFTDALLEKLKISKAAIKFKLYPKNVSDTIFVCSHRGIYHIILSNGFFWVLQEAPEIAKVMVCHELAHIRNGDLGAFHEVKIFLRRVLVFYLPPLLILLFIYAFASPVETSMTSLYISVLLMPVLTIANFVLRLIYGRIVVAWAETNADFLTAMCCGSDQVLAALQYVQSRSNFFSSLFNFNPSVGRRIRWLDRFHSIFGEIEKPIALSNALEEINKGQEPVQGVQRWGWLKFVYSDDRYFYNRLNKKIVLFLIGLLAMLSLVHLTGMYNNVPGVLQRDYYLLVAYNGLELLGYIGAFYIAWNGKSKIIITLLGMSAFSIIFHTVLLLEFVKDPASAVSNFYWQLTIGFAVTATALTVLHIIFRHAVKASGGKTFFAYSMGFLGLTSLLLITMALWGRPVDDPQLEMVINVSGASYHTSIDSVDCQLLTITINNDDELKTLFVENTRSLLRKPKFADNQSTDRKLLPAECFFGTDGIVAYNDLNRSHKHVFEESEMSFLGLAETNLFIRSDDENMYWVLNSRGPAIIQLVVVNDFYVSVIKKIEAPSFYSYNHHFFISADKKYLLVDGFEGEVRIYSLSFAPDA